MLVKITNFVEVSLKGFFQQFDQFRMERCTTVLSSSTGQAFPAINRECEAGCGTTFNLDSLSRPAVVVYGNQVRDIHLLATFIASRFDA